MTEEDGVYFGEAQAENILEAVDLVQRSGDALSEFYPQQLSPNQFWYVKLTEDLDAPADADNPTTATANVWRAKEDDTLEDTEEEINVTNRFVGFSASDDSLITVVLEEGEYVPQSPSGTARKVVMLCANLSGRAATGQNGGVLGTISSALGAVLGPHPTVANRIVQTGESITISNIWDIDFTAHQLVAVESGLLGFAWTPYGADCGNVGSDGSFWDEYSGSLGCE